MKIQLPLIYKENVVIGGGIYGRIEGNLFSIEPSVVLFAFFPSTMNLKFLYRNMAFKVFLYTLQ